MPTCEICGNSFERPLGGGNLNEGGTAFKCPTCAAKDLASSPTPKQTRRVEAQQFAAELNRIAPGQPVVTYALIAICTAVFAIEISKGAGFNSMSVDLAQRLGADYGPLTLGGQWWRLVTSMFLHFGFFHILMNMWCLWALGSVAERLMGRAAYTLLYFASGIGGSLLSVGIHPQLVSAGASGAVFGVAGGLITYLGLKKSPMDISSAKKQLTSLAIFVGYNFLYSLGPGIDMMAHLGGLLSGLVIAAVLPPFLRDTNSQMALGPAPEKSAINTPLVAIGGACAIAAVVAFFGIQHSQADSLYVGQSLSEIDAGHSTAVIPKLEQIVKRQPNSDMAHFALGAAYLRTNQGASAVAELTKADQLGPGNRVIEQNLGAAYLVQDDYDLAFTKFQQVLSDQPNNPQAHLGLATALLGKHQDREAVSEARKVLVSLPDVAEAHAILGEAEIRIGSVDDGVSEMEKSVQLAPDNQDLRTQLLAAYASTGRKPHFADSGTPTGAPADNGAKKPKTDPPAAH